MSNLWEQNLQQIALVDEVAKQTMARHLQRLPDKYATIQSTLKLLHHLIASFQRRAQQHEQELQQRAKLTDLIDRISFHRARIQDCQRMSQALASKLEHKKEYIGQEETQAQLFRAQLLQLKTDNVKKLLRLQGFEEARQQEEFKENVEVRKATKKMKTEYSRKMHRNTAQEQDQWQLQKQQLTRQLCAALKHKQQLSHFLSEMWQVASACLLKQERKSSSQGLKGSLMFRMLQNGQKSRPLKEGKLMIYDVLRAKYREHKKSQKEGWDGSEQDFMQYTPMQVLGVIALQGGVDKLQQMIASYEQETAEQAVAQLGL